MNNIENFFTPGEGYCEYNQDQIKLMREKIFKNLANEVKEKNSDKIPAAMNIAGMTDKRDDEEEGDYILGLA